MAASVSLILTSLCLLPLVSIWTLYDGGNMKHTSPYCVSCQGNLESFKLPVDLVNFNLTSPLHVTLFCLVQEGPSTPVITNLFVVIACKLTSQTFSINNKILFQCDFLFASSPWCFNKQHRIIYLVHEWNANTEQMWWQPQMMPSLPRVFLRKRRSQPQEGGPEYELPWAFDLWLIGFHWSNIRKDRQNER